VGGEEPAEELGICRKRRKNATAKPRAGVHTEEMKAKPRRDTGKAAVCLLIEMQIIGFEGVRESEGLVEAEAEAIAGNRVDPTRGVADQDPSPESRRTSRRFSACNVAGKRPSPQALSIGGSNTSATTTSSPAFRAAIAAARPAGPPPTTNTSNSAAIVPRRVTVARRSRLT